MDNLDPSTGLRDVGEQWLYEACMPVTYRNTLDSLDLEQARPPVYYATVGKRSRTMCGTKTTASKGICQRRRNERVYSLSAASEKIHLVSLWRSISRLLIDNDLDTYS